MNETSTNYRESEYKTECDHEVCVSELSPSAIRGANKLIELSNEVAFESVFNV
jgi:hypothetical protein